MKQMKIIKKQDDTRLGLKVLRASLGGNAAVGYYITYRGSKEEILDLLKQGVEAMEALKDEPAISPDEGKMYA